MVFKHANVYKMYFLHQSFRPYDQIKVRFSHLVNVQKKCNNRFSLLNLRHVALRQQSVEFI